MPDTFTIVDFVSNFLVYMFVLFAVQINCKSRFRTWLTILLEFVSFAGYIITSLLPFLSIIRALFGWFYILLVVQLLFKDKWYFKLIAGSASVMAMLMSDILFQAISPRDIVATREFMRSYPIATYSVFLFINIIVQSINVVFVRMLSKRGSFFQNKLQALLALAFPINQFLSLWLFFSTYMNLDAEYSPWQLIPTVLTYLLADIALVFLFMLVEKNAKIQAKNEMLEEEVAFQTKYYEKLGASYDQMRKMRHDIDNHLYTIQALISSGRADEAADYAREVSEKDADNPIFVSCENMVLASFIDKKTEDFSALEITPDIDIHMPKETGISNTDLICIFGNILDNALESCDGLENAQVKMHAEYKVPYLSILCENPIGKQKNKKKTPEMERGLGLLILNELANKYDGDLKAAPNGDLFRTQLVLKGDTSND